MLRKGLKVQNFDEVKEKVSVTEGAIKDLKSVQDWIRVYKSNALFNTIDCYWEPKTFSLTSLCNNNKTLPLRISVFCY